MPRTSRTKLATFPSPYKVQVQVEVVEHRREEVDIETGRRRSWVEVEEREVLDLTGAPLVNLPPCKGGAQARPSPRVVGEESEEEEESKEEEESEEAQARPSPNPWSEDDDEVEIEEISWSEDDDEVKIVEIQSA